VSWTPRDELERVRRVSDQLCSAHAALRDKYGRLALILDLVVLALSVWLIALAFIDPLLDLALTPFGLEPRLWIGFLAIGTFLLTLVQFKTNWKGRSDAHQRTSELYADVKREAGYVLADESIDESSYRRVLARYDLASAAGVAVPEREFLTQKSRHKTKVAMSRYLDTHPSASLFLVRVRFWIRDTFGRGEVKENGGSRQGD
jgi:hypothetical protein